MCASNKNNSIINNNNVMYCQVWWPILEIGALHLTHPSAHTAVSSEHAPGAVGSHCSSARGAIGGSVPCSRTPQSWYWGWRERWLIILPTNNPCRTWDSNPQPLDYKSNSLTIRPRLPPSSMLSVRIHVLQALHVLLFMFTLSERDRFRFKWGKVAFPSLFTVKICIRCTVWDFFCYII